MARDVRAAGGLHERLDDGDTLPGAGAGARPVTALAVAQYLRDHPVLPDRVGPELLCRDAGRTVCYVRWPSGSTRWETESSLVRRGFHLPARGVLEEAP